MINQRKVIAIIPARGGSKGIPKKNIKLVAGKPLIAYTIECSKRSKYIDQIFVSTDNEKIAEVSKEYGAKVIERPKELAGDTSQTIDAIKHAVHSLPNLQDNDILLVLQPTAPLRTTEYIDLCVEKMAKTDCQSVTTVSKNEHNPYTLVYLEGDKTEFCLGKPKITNRQEILNIYRIDSVVHGITKEALMNETNYIVCDDNRAIVISEENKLDIDNMRDLKLAEEIIKGRIKMKKIKIGSNIIGKDEPCFIIAEAGCNHNGDMKLAKMIIDEAVEAKVDAIKFQTFLTEKLVTKETPKAEYQKTSNADTESYFDMLKQLEISETDWIELKNYCDKKGILFLSTPHSDKWSVDLLEKLGVAAYKVGSGDLTNLPFLEYMAKLGKPIILSAGMANMEETIDAVNTVKRAGNDDIIILQCTTSYPCELKDVNLKAMTTIKQETGMLVGYSDHTLGSDASVSAVARGAVVIEKHFTLDKNMPGPDHKASATPDELKELVQRIRNVEKLLGTSQKKPTAGELEIMKIARKSIIANRDIKQGETITDDMLIIKRPGIGLAPKNLPELLGKKAAIDIKQETLVKKDWFI
jgi:N-acetylneuraminate synthase